MPDKEKLVILPYSKDREITAEYFARRRLIFEYPRPGYGSYDESHLPSIASGYLGELAFLEFVTDKFKDEFKDTDSYWEAVKEKYEFTFHLLIGDYDKGFEFLFGDISIDVKTYGTQKVSVERIFSKPLHLFIDATQSKNANIYVQSFLLDDGSVCLAGYHLGLPPIATWMPKRAHCAAVPDLNAMSDLFAELHS